jgi:undecaprenyl-diphosphatase
MEEIIKAIVLGIVQGLTEFLPISSTAHLRIIPAFFGWKDIGSGYTAVMQIGTMIAIIIYFWKDLMNMFISVVKSAGNKDYKSNPHTRLFINVAIGTIPILIFGYALKDFIDHQFRSLYVISITMILFSIVIAIAEKVSKMNNPIENLNIKDSIIIGLFQSIALIPGTSRSGSTMSGAFFRNMNREAAARYSFLLSIPAVLISGLYKLYSERKVLLASGDSIESIVIATVVSGIVGFISIWFLLRFLKTHTMMLFIVYRIILGVIVLVLLLANIIQ